jgi:hypothetical protein
VHARHACRYAAHAERFLRVSFANDALRTLREHQLSDAVQRRMMRLMLGGIELAHRHFRFLGFSSSQLREHSCWMYCEDDRGADGAPSADAIRAAAGHLDEIRNPSKWAARFAQCFSTTYETLKLSPVRRAAPHAAAHGRHA